MKMTFSDYVSHYKNTSDHNDWIWRTFEELTNKTPFLKEHRDHIEKYELGFGDRAFHYMWYLIFTEIKPQKVLEIGVYMGQVISLWALICRQSGIKTSISAISPFEGNQPPKGLLNNQVINLTKSILSPLYRRHHSVGNHYERMDYLQANRSLFEKFELHFDDVNIIRGLSSDLSVLEVASKNVYELIYIDGDHRYEQVVSDIKSYLPLLAENGLLVMDDASYFLPGTVFWKGHKEVSSACKHLERMGLKNILNVGHNRIFQKINTP